MSNCVFVYDTFILVSRNRYSDRLFIALNMIQSSHTMRCINCSIGRRKETFLLLNVSSSTWTVFVRETNRTTFGRVRGRWKTVPALSKLKRVLKKNYSNRLLTEAENVLVFIRLEEYKNKTNFKNRVLRKEPHSISFHSTVVYWAKTWV